MSDDIAREIRGPDGRPITREKLPPARTRWTVGKKATVILAVRAGLITVEEVASRYAMSVEELGGWAAAFDEFGYEGLSRAAMRRRSH